MVAMGPDALENPQPELWEIPVKFEREFIRLGATWLACRLAVMGGTPESGQHFPVSDFRSLGWAMLGCVDYSAEMRLLCREAQGGPSLEKVTPEYLPVVDKA